jgi:hypothetical protein
VLAADWLVRRGYDRDDVFLAPALRPAQLGAWLAGFALYQWLIPTGPSWWIHLVGRLQATGWGFGASLPSFAVAFAVSALVNVLAREREPSSSAA